MNTDTPNIPTPNDNPASATANSSARVAHEDLFTKANNGAIDALEYGICGMTTGNESMVREAVSRLRGVIKQEKKKEEEKKEKEKKERKRKRREKKKEEEKKERRRRRRKEKKKKKEKEKEKAEREKEKKEKEKEKEDNITTSTTTRRTTSAHRVTKSPRSWTPHEEPGTPQHRSMRIVDLTKKTGLNRLYLGTTAQDSPTATTPVEEGIVERLGDRLVLETRAKVGGRKGRVGPANAASKVDSPILKPRAGAGITKRSYARGLKARTKVKMEDEEEDQTITTTTTTTTTTGQIPKTRRTRKSRGGYQTPLRRSMRIIELGQKSAQEKGKTVAAVPERRGRKATGGRRRCRGRGGRKASA